MNKKQSLELAPSPAKTAGKTTASRPDNLNAQPSPKLQYRNGGKGTWGGTFGTHGRLPSFQGELSSRSRKRKPVYTVGG